MKITHVLLLSVLEPSSPSPSSEQHSVSFRIDAHSEDRVCYAIAKAKHSPAWAHQGIQVCWACPVAGTSGAAWLAFLSESGKLLKRIRKRLEGSPGQEPTLHLSAPGGLASSIVVKYKEESVPKDVAFLRT